MAVPDDVLNDLYKQLDILSKRVEKLENNSAPSLPIYDSTNWPIDAFEGQVVIAPIVE